MIKQLQSQRKNLKEKVVDNEYVKALEKYGENIKCIKTDVHSKHTAMKTIRTTADLVKFKSNLHYLKMDVKIPTKPANLVKKELEDNSDKFIVTNYIRFKEMDCAKLNVTNYIGVKEVDWTVFPDLDDELYLKERYKFI
jgi:hypothetical protein